MVQNIPSGSVEYDRHGYRTKAGKDDANGEFQGQISQLVRNANGYVIEKTTTTWLLPSQEILEHNFYGPFGLAESTLFSSGKPASVHTISYDQLGNVLDDLTTDGGGKPQAASADAGYFSEANVTDESVAGIDLHIATGRDHHKIDSRDMGARSLVKRLLEIISLLI